MSYSLFAASRSVFAQTWTQTSAPDTAWHSVAMSADGSKLVAASFMTDQGNLGSIYTSTNSGTTWVQTSAPSNSWVSVASSADGSKLAAVSGPSVSGSVGAIFTSTNSGITWISNNAPNFTWYYIASSADGTKLVATADDRPAASFEDFVGVVYTSTNSGVTWVSNSLPVTVRYWYSVASSADGEKLVVVSQFGQICTSTNSGATWQQATNAPDLIWSFVASSADGTKLAAVSQLQSPANGGSICTSTNSGLSWTSNNAPNIGWSAIASSADGTKLVASGYGGSPATYVSTNAGAIWQQGATTLNTFLTIASSADGNRLAATYGGGIVIVPGGVYVSYSTATPLLNINNTMTNLNLTWLVPSTNFVLQQDLDLNTTNWLNVTNTAVLNLTNLHNQVTLPLPIGNTFYRLKTP